MSSYSSHSANTYSTEATKGLHFDVVFTDMTIEEGLIINFLEINRRKRIKTFNLNLNTQRLQV